MRTPKRPSVIGLVPCCPGIMLIVLSKAMASREVVVKLTPMLPTSSCGKRAAGALVTQYRQVDVAVLDRQSPNDPRVLSFWRGRFRRRGVLVETTKLFSGAGSCQGNLPKNSGETARWLQRGTENPATKNTMVHRDGDTMYLSMVSSPRIHAVPTSGVTTKSVHPVLFVGGL